MVLRQNRVVPLAVESAWVDVDGGHHRVFNFDTERVFADIELCVDLEPGSSGCSADELDDDLMGEQWLAAPVHRDEAEHPLLDLVPLARARWVVAHGDPQAGVIRELLQAGLPDTGTVAVAPARVRRHKDLSSIRVGALPHLAPPPAEAGDGELWRVVIRPNAHPPDVVGDVIDAVRDGFAKLGVDEVVNAHRVRCALRAPLAAPILEGPHQLLLLGVYGDNGLPTLLKGLYLSR